MGSPVAPHFAWCAENKRGRSTVMRQLFSRFPYTLVSFPACKLVCMASRRPSSKARTLPHAASCAMVPPRAHQQNCLVAGLAIAVQRAHDASAESSTCSETWEEGEDSAQREAWAWSRAVWVSGFWSVIPLPSLRPWPSPRREPTWMPFPTPTPPTPTGSGCASWPDRPS